MKMAVNANSCSDTPLTWGKCDLFSTANKWKKKTRKRMNKASERSPWWYFIPRWNKELQSWLLDFQLGKHQFSPLKEYRFPDGVVQVWCFLDRLINYLLLTIIKPTFKHIISPYCLHLKGQNVIKDITAAVQSALDSKQYQYFMRLDIRSYYASIDHKILIQQIFENFADPMIRHYLKAIITAAIDRDGVIRLPTKGIPLRSSLSPFFGALYLSKLDQAFTKCQGIFYLRYMDDIIVLVKNKRQYQKLRKRLHIILRELKLKLSPHKSKSGRLCKHEKFHYLGVELKVPQAPESKTQVSKISLHKRSYRRALDKVEALCTNSVHPAKIQRYLVNWATWWSRVSGISKVELWYNWTKEAESRNPDVAWLGQGLLLGMPSNSYNNAAYGLTCSCDTAGF